MSTDSTANPAPMTPDPKAAERGEIDYRWNLVRAVSALENWGRHFTSCATQTSRQPDAQCDCGLAQTIAELRPAPLVRFDARLLPDDSGYEVGVGFETLPSLSPAAPRAPAAEGEPLSQGGISAIRYMVEHFPIQDAGESELHDRAMAAMLQLGESEEVERARHNTIEAKNRLLAELGDTVLAFRQRLADAEERPNQLSLLIENLVGVLQLDGEEEQNARDWPLRNLPEIVSGIVGRLAAAEREASTAEIQIAANTFRSLEGRRSDYSAMLEVLDQFVRDRRAALATRPASREDT